MAGWGIWCWNWDMSKAKLQNKIKIIVTFCQLVSGFGFVLDLDFPDPCQAWMEHLNFFNLEIFNFIPFDCFFEANYFDNLVGVAYV